MNVENIGRGPAERQRRCRAAVTVETVRAAAPAFAAGVIELEEPAKTIPDARRSFAPSFISGNKDSGAPESFPYTAATIQSFLGWDKSASIESALAILGAEERNMFDASAMDGMSLDPARKLATASRRAEEKLREAADFPRFW